MIIGIDLGTTNCTLAYSTSDNKIKQFSIPQLTSATTVEALPSLPSFLYFPLNEEKKGELDKRLCAGVHARKRAAEVPDRVIASAKSWLCNGGIDRRQPILPIGLEDPDLLLSPLQACSELLLHIKHAWNSAMPDAPFNQQEILITVPASFDPSARQLVQEAAAMAGYPEVTLIEEPLAAFYAWLEQHPEEWRKQLHIGDKILVVDIGGGTTDFTLITADAQNGDLQLNRLAVGSHLLLGGDNLDLTLAHDVKQQMEEEGTYLDDWQVQSLIHACRQAKEQFLSDKPPQHLDLTIQGRGTKLIGNTLTKRVTVKEVQHLLVEGFFPNVKPTQRSAIEKRTGIQQIGLPYAQDPRVSCQLAKFLSQTGELESDSMEHFIYPTAILFNGGTLKAPLLRQRLLEIVAGWSAAPVKELPGADYEFAVSRGAVYYGLSRKGKGIRVKSGTSRSYYVGVEDAVPAVPGIPIPLKAVCVVPFGMEEGSEARLDQQEFALVLGERAVFRFFSHATPTLSDGTSPKVGTIVRQWKKELTELPAIETQLEKQETDGKVVRIKLKSKVTELGVLELWCEALDGRRWKLEFDTREKDLATQAR